MNEHEASDMDAVDEPDRIVDVEGVDVGLYACGRGRNRRYWPVPFEQLEDGPWYLRPSAVRSRVGVPKSRRGAKWTVVRIGRRGRRDRYLEGATVEDAVAAALSDEAGW